MDEQPYALIVRHIGWWWWTVSGLYAEPGPKAPEIPELRRKLLRVYLTRAGARRYANRHATIRIMYEP